MKIQIRGCSTLAENTKLTLTIGQIKQLIKESETDYVFIPLGLIADTNITKIIDPEIYGNPSPWSILDDLCGQLSDGKWENSPRMDRFWRYFDLVDINGEINLRIPTAPDYRNNYKNLRRQPVPNGFLAEYGGLGGNPKKIREWIANHLKILVQDEVGKENWKRDCDKELDYFESGTTVAMVYAVYDILKNRPERNKNIYFDAFHA